MTMRNHTRCVRLLSLFGLAFAVACESDPTNPGRQAKPAFVLLAPGTVAQVSAGPAALHTCAVRTDGTVACWGENAYQKATPAVGSFTQVSAGGYHTCGLKTDGTAVCWGYHPPFLGPPPPGAFIPTFPPGDFTQISAGSRHTCGIKTDGTVACWAANPDDPAPPLPPPG